MGGRGASGGGKYGKKGDTVYGTEYTTVFKAGNIKFIVVNNGSNKSPMETQTNGRVYVTVDKNKNDLKTISYYDNDNKRVKQIDLDKAHNGLQPHTHHGYEHNENDSPKGAAKLTTEEKIMVDNVQTLWYNHINGK
ncbi:MAG: hypothetical protein K2O14_11215 [Oscillospiraceae bacterium]|nr:hypothetical protein [Oscillospiraceae bacterium]